MLARSCEVLGVTIHSTVREVKDAYRTKAALLHPDAGGEVGVFTELNNAYIECRKYAENAPCPNCVDGYVSLVAADFKVTRMQCTKCNGTGKRG